MNNLVCVILPLSAFLLATPSYGAERSEHARPNVVFVVVDDAGYDDFGFMGCKDWKTPHIDSIANNGVVFTDAYVTASVCRRRNSCGSRLGTLRRKNSPPR